MITVYHHSANLVLANGDPRDGFFLFHPHTHDIFLYYFLSIIVIIIIIIIIILGNGQDTDRAAGHVMAQVSILHNNYCFSHSMFFKSFSCFYIGLVMRNPSYSCS